MKCYLVVWECNHKLPFISGFVTTTWKVRVFFYAFSLVLTCEKIDWKPVHFNTTVRRLKLAPSYPWMFGWALRPVGSESDKWRAVGNYGRTRDNSVVERRKEEEQLDVTLDQRIFLICCCIWRRVSLTSWSKLADSWWVNKLVPPYLFMILGRVQNHKSHSLQCFGNQFYPLIHQDGKYCAICSELSARPDI